MIRFVLGRCGVGCAAAALAFGAGAAGAAGAGVSDSSADDDVAAALAFGAVGTAFFDAAAFLRSTVGRPSAMYSRPLGGTPTTAAQPTAPMTWSFIDVAAPTSATSSLWRGVLPVEIAPPHLRRLRHRRIECPHGNDFWKMAEYKHMRFVHRLYEFPYDHCAPIFRRGGRRPGGRSPP